MNTNQILQNGIKLVESGNLDEGMKLINQAISIEPSDPEKIHIRAQINSAVGKHQEAISDYKKCIFLKSDIFQYHYNLANVYFDTRQFAQAVDYYTSAIKINPNDPDIYSNRGTCYIQISQRQLAYNDFQKALSMNPNDQPAKRGLNILLSVDPNLGKSQPKVATTSMDEIKIGTQIWTRRNLNVDRFRNGDPIIEAKTIQDWNIAGDNKQPAWCYYDNNPNNAVLYGKLYNWYAVNDKRGLSPEGWIVPSNSNWLTMINFLGGEGIAANKLIVKRSLLQESKSDSGFDGMIGGHRMAAGHFIGNGEFCSWWSSTEDGINSALSRGIRYGEPYVGEGHSNKGFGYFIRCIKKI